MHYSLHKKEKKFDFAMIIEFYVLFLTEKMQKVLIHIDNLFLYTFPLRKST